MRSRVKRVIILYNLEAFCRMKTADAEAYLRGMRFFTLAVALVLAAACFFPWVTVPSRQLVLTGVDALNFGKPGYLHFIFSALVVLLIFIPKPVGQKAAVLFAAFNFAWALRNFVLLAACQMGDCPVRQTAIYVVLVSSVLLLVGVLLVRNKPAPAVSGEGEGETTAVD